MRSSSFLLRFWQYFLSIILIPSITAIFFALRDALDTTLVALLYLIPLGMITAFWGLVPGITGALITFLAFNFTLPLIWDGVKAPELPIDTETE